MNNFRFFGACSRPAFVLSLVFSLGLVQGAYAQLNVNQQLPVQVNPGLLAPAPTDLVDPRNVPEVEAPTPTPEVNIDVPVAPGIVELQGNQFEVKTITIEGNTVVSTEELQPLVVPYQGKTLTLDELSKLVEQISAKYRERGHLTSIAYIPPQDITSGNIVVKVMEGKVGDVEISGNKFFKTGIIARYLDVKTGENLNISQLEKNLAGINQNNDFRVRAVMSPGEATGETDLRLEVEERQPWQISGTFDNQGRPGIGTMRTGIELLNRNLTGVGDRFNARWMRAAGTQVVMGSYFLPLNKYGTEVGVLFGYSSVALDLDDVDDADHPIVTGNAYNYGLLVSQPLDARRIWTTDVGLNFRRVSSYFETLNVKSRTNVDDIRSLQVGLSFNKPDRWGRTFARVQNTFGLDWLGARHWQTGQDQPTSNTQFWKLETLLNRVVVLPKRNFLLLRGYAQFTPDALPPAEQFQVGGAYSVRGYTEGLLTGDRGFNVAAEWRWPVPFLSSVSPWLSKNVMGAFFADYGQAYFDRSNPNFIRVDRTRRLRTSLLSVGFGVRARLTQYLQGFLDAGFGLLDRELIEPNAQPVARIHFGIRTDLLPENYKAWGRDTVRVEHLPGRRVMLTKVDEPQTPPATPMPSEDKQVEPVEFSPEETPSAAPVTPDVSPEQESAAPAEAETPVADAVAPAEQPAETESPAAE